MILGVGGSNFYPNTIDCLFLIPQTLHNIFHNKSPDYKNMGLTRKKISVNMQYGFKLSHNNIGYSDKIFTFPYFCAFLLKHFVKDFCSENYIEM